MAECENVSVQALNIEEQPLTALKSTFNVSEHAPDENAAGAAAASDAPLAARLFSDLVFDCGSRHLARRLSSSPTASWLYRFDQRARDDESPPSWGVTHGAEVPFSAVAW